MNNSNNRQRNDIGAAWLNQGQNGDYISISLKPEALQEFDLVNCFITMSVNPRKSKPTHPDYLITAKPKPAQAQTQAPQQQAKPSAFPKPRNFAPGADNGGGWDDGDPGPEFR